MAQSISVRDIYTDSEDDSVTKNHETLSQSGMSNLKSSCDERHGPDPRIKVKHRISHTDIYTDSDDSCNGENIVNSVSEQRDRYANSDVDDEDTGVLGHRISHADLYTDSDDSCSAANVGNSSYEQWNDDEYNESDIGDESDEPVVQEIVLNKYVVDAERGGTEQPPVLEYDEELAHNFAINSQIYNKYTCHGSMFGKQHPSVVVESSSLACISSPKISVALLLPETCFSRRRISNVQEVAVRLAVQQHETVRSDGFRSGFLLGDGAGMGKGRIISAIIYNNYLRGTEKALWISVSPDLCDVAQKDMCDIGADIPVKAISKFTNGIKLDRGVLFCTYSTLIRKTRTDSRLDEIVKWFGTNYDGVIAFDEAHRAKNIDLSPNGKGSLFGEAVFRIQKLLPNSRVVYVSATGASEPQNMIYMTRIGLWGKEGLFSSPNDFLNRMENYDVGGMELLAMHLKSKGSYIARHLSYHGVKFIVEEVQVSKSFIEMYDQAAILWSEMYAVLQQLILLGLVGKNVFGWFWAAHQRFFKHLCVASKVEHAINITRSELLKGNCVVIGLQSTGESSVDDLILKEHAVYDELISTAGLILEETFAKCFATRVTLGDGDSSSEEDVKNQGVELNGLLIKARTLQKKLPKNTIDEIIYKLRGPKNVAELTARKGRLIGSGGRFAYQSRRSRKAGLTNNQMERNYFMSGQKLVAIISDAASTGISLHADNRIENTRKRIHITLELPWSADKAIQQFGRTHRSNQISPPVYILLVSGIAGDRRFAAGVAKRLESLGALGQGDRRAGPSNDLAQFNVDTLYGAKALSVVMEVCKGQRAPILLPEHGVEKMVEDMRVGLESVGLLSKKMKRTPVSQFLNRILGIPMGLQNHIFNYFSSILSSIVQASKKMGRFDEGILDLGSTIVANRETIRVLRKKSDEICFEKLTIDRGMSWEAAYEKYLLCSSTKSEGFYVSSFSKKRLIVLVVKDMDEKFAIYRPATGRSAKLELKDEIRKRNRISLRDAQTIWKEHYQQAAESCLHFYLFNKCKLVNEQKVCNYGKRWKEHCIITGQLLTIWPTLQSVLQSIRLIRFPVNDSTKVVAVMVEDSDVQPLLTTLEKRYTE